MITPQGIRKQAAIVFMPVKALTVAEAPVMSMDETMTLVARAKNMSVRWEKVPHRTLMTSRNVCAEGA